jgi:hypothetical protein
LCKRHYFPLPELPIPVGGEEGVIDYFLQQRELQFMEMCCGKYLPYFYYRDHEINTEGNTPEQVEESLTRRFGIPLMQADNFLGNLDHKGVQTSYRHMLEPCPRLREMLDLIHSELCDLEE